ncbi:synaptic vesicle glycoprotein 2B-like [Venturia canescens]|uniref:synaptic vesicle glycoprotein 2B-like n=1 Tax=Venturia canescens TaxID=32260 RepID=UPI001C9C167A|nr:synaptic vesicle glycoprotein 2B-like [Venturia canescens]
MASTEEIAPKSDESDVQYAVDQTGFGKFTIKLAVLGGLIYMNTGLCIGSVGFILPSAACDLELTTLDKGRISATPILGMVFGAYFWGCFADLRGRKSALLYALFSYAIIEFVTSLVTNYWIFLLLKFFSGWAMNGQGTIVFTYVGEFQSNEFREKILCWMEMAWTIGIIILPLVAWVIIPLEFAYVVEGFLFRSWNLFIIVCAIPSVIIATWLTYFPDTPKFLAESNQDEKFARTLEKMYTENTGCTFDEYLDKLRKNGYENLRTKLTLAAMKKNSTGAEASPRESTRKSNSLLNMLRTVVTQTINLWKPPHLYPTIIVCGLMYCFGSSYYALMLWFPELFQRFAEFESSQPGEASSVCKISSYNQMMTNDSKTDVVCSSTIQSDVYLHTLILGLACLPVSIILPLLVNKLGYKFYMIISASVASMVTVGFFYVSSSVENLVLSCIFEAFSSVCMSIIFCLVVDLFPTNLRALAASLCGLFARIGALVGNSLFGVLIDNYCVPLIGIIAGQLILSTILSFLIPGKSKKLKNQINQMDQYEKKINSTL